MAKLTRSLDFVLMISSHQQRGGSYGILQFILDNQPRNLHLVICTREDPPLRNWPVCVLLDQLT